MNDLMVNNLASEKQQLKYHVIRWTTSKGLAAIILFLATAILIEYSIILYVMNIGVREKQEHVLQWNFSFPGTNWTIGILVSPLFHLIPLSVIIVLLFSWAYLTKYAAIAPKEKTKPPPKKEKRETGKFFARIKSRLLKIKGIAYLRQKIFAKATVKSALLIFAIFGTFFLITLYLAYPRILYNTISHAYQSNQGFHNFMKSASQILAVFGGWLSPIRDALMSAAPSFRNFVSSFSIVTKPLAILDNVGKYLVIQNVAAWICALSVLFYVEFARKGYRVKPVAKAKGR